MFRERLPYYLIGLGFQAKRRPHLSVHGSRPARGFLVSQLSSHRGIEIGAGLR